MKFPELRKEIEEKNKTISEIKARMEKSERRIDKAENMGLMKDNKIK
jgi:hypothetical protein